MNISCYPTYQLRSILQYLYPLTLITFIILQSPMPTASKQRPDPLLPTCHHNHISPAPSHLNRATVDCRMG